MVLDAQHNRKLLEDSEQGESTLTFVFLKTYSLPSPPVFPLLLRSLLVPSFLPSPIYSKQVSEWGVMDPKVPATGKRGGYAQGWGGIRGITQMDTWGWNAQVELKRWAAGLV